MKPGEFWDREVVEQTVVSWMEPLETRRYINEQITGDPNVWPLEWFKANYAREPFEHALSIGCGSGPLERSLMKLGICRRIDAFDGSISSLAIARDEARRERWPSIRYFASDFNRPTLPERTYDAVFFHQSLHHVGKLEKLYRAVLRSLKPGGLVYLEEFVGPSRHQWSRRKTKPWNELYQQLPRRDRFRRLFPLPVQWNDLSEAVRSAEIIPQLRIGFDIAELRGYGGNVLAVMYPAIRPRAITPQRIEWMRSIEKEWLARGDVPFHAVVVAYPKSGRAVRIAALRYMIEPKVKRLFRELLRLATLGQLRR